jgi:membrane-associated phospholipid phosphatase
VPSRLIRAAGWASIAVGVAAPLVRRRARLPAPVVIGLAGVTPVALAVVRPRTRGRDVGICALQMWAYLTAYKMPHDDPEGLESRVHVDYPVRVDRVLGAGTLPTVRLQRRLATPGAIRPIDQVFVWAHWLWFFVPHSALVYILLRRRDMFERAACQTYAVFDLGALVYWLVPTAPPWYAAEAGRTGDVEPPVRRMMVEHGEGFWRRGWQPLYSLLGGNPVAAMPSVHFATSVMAAHLLTDAGPGEGIVGWGYAATLGFALVYLGEHYLVDLVAGLALTEGVRVAAPRVAPLTQRFARVIRRLEVRAIGA